MRFTCKDCGVRLTDENTDRDRLISVCDGCWETRGEIVAGKIVPLNSPEFREIQRKMVAGRGTAKRYIDSLRGGE